MKTSTILMSVGALLIMGASPAMANGNSSDDDRGPIPSDEPFDNNDNAWACGEDEFVPDHCINTRSQGTVRNIMVFDDRGPQEGSSTDPKFDDRPCPNEEEQDNGTWWEIVPGLFVCHHSGGSK